MPIGRRIFKCIGFSLSAIWAVSFFVVLEAGNGRDLSGRFVGGALVIFDGVTYDGLVCLPEVFGVDHVDGIEWQFQPLLGSMRESLSALSMTFSVPELRGQADSMFVIAPLGVVLLAPGVVALLMTIRDRRFFRRCRICDGIGHRFRATSCRYCGHSLDLRGFSINLPIATLFSLAVTLWIRAAFEDITISLEHSLIMPVAMICYCWTVYELRRVRASQQRRAGVCQLCGYDLTGNVSGRCSECGAAIPRVIASAGSRWKARLSSRAARRALWLAVAFGAFWVYFFNYVSPPAGTPITHATEPTLWTHLLAELQGYRDWGWMVMAGCLAVAAWCLTTAVAETRNRERVQAVA